MRRLRTALTRPLRPILFVLTRTLDYVANGRNRLLLKLLLLYHPCLLLIRGEGDVRPLGRRECATPTRACIDFQATHHPSLAPPVATFPNLPVRRVDRLLLARPAQVVMVVVFFCSLWALGAICMFCVIW